MINDNGWSWMERGLRANAYFYVRSAFQCVVLRDSTEALVVDRGYDRRKR